MHLKGSLPAKVHRKEGWRRSAAELVETQEGEVS